MALSNDQIQEIAKSQPQKNLLQKAVKHEQRLRFHTETILQKNELGQPWKDFIAWLGSEKPIILEKDKVDRIDQLIQPPLQTVELTESIFSRLYRVFFPQDGFATYNFKDDALLSDWTEFRDTEFWRTKGFEAMESAINSVWVVDLPEGEQTTERPEPVNRLIRIEQVLDIKVDDYNNCIYVIFRDGDVLYAYDEEFIRAYRYNNDKLSAQPESEIPHGLDYTPARMFWSEKLESKDFINKEAPITKELPDLDWLLFHMASKKYMDLANSFPILVTYNLEGGYTDDSITSRNGPEGGSTLGAGTEIEVDIPKEGDFDLMANPMKYINPDVSTLDWHVKEEIRLTNKIFKSVVGADKEDRNEEAKNELQVGSAYESQESVLIRTKVNFEIINKFADKTICLLRYGDQFEGCTIDYGTKFFLKSEADLYEDYKTAKDAGAEDIVLSEINDSILATRFRDDNAGMTRAAIIGDLDPLPEKTVEESIKIFEKGGIDRVNFIIKMNLLSFVKRFERENLPLNMWGGEREYGDVINSINEIFMNYAKERSNSEPQD